MSRIENVITASVTDNIVDAIKKQGISLTSAMPNADAGLVARAVAADVGPVVQNLTNNEPWYQSRVTWGALLAILFPLLRVAGVKTDLIDPKAAIDVIMSAVAVAGGAFALYGRYIGKKPLGA